MMNMTRGEPFTIEIFFDLDMDALDSFEVRIVQNGKTLLCKGMDEAIVDREEKCAYVILSAEETARLRGGDPACAQTLCTLIDGEKLHSEVEEINVFENLGERSGTAWLTDG